MSTDGIHKARGRLFIKYVATCVRVAWQSHQADGRGPGPGVESPVGG